MSKDDPTLSASEFQDDLDTAVPEKLLGDKSLERRNSEGVLIRIEQGLVSSQIAEKLGVEPYTPPHKGLQPFPALILGPFPFSKIREWVEQGVISHNDFLIKPFDRWRIIVSLFPDLASQPGTISGTETLTDTKSLKDNQFGEDKTVTPLTDSDLELEGQETAFIEPIPEDTMREIKQAQAERDRAKQVQELTQAAPIIAQQPKPGFVSYLRNINPVLGVLIPVSVTALVFLWMNRAEIQSRFFSGDKKSLNNAAENIAENTEGAGNQDSNLDVPFELRPIDGFVNYEDDDPLVRKIRPILLNYQKGITLLTDSDELLLTGFSQSGTSSWEARRLASNQLAVFLLSTQRADEGLKILEPIYEAVPGDPVTLLNLALLAFVKNKLDVAEQMAEAAQRTAPQELKWVAHVLLGRVRASKSGVYSAAANTSFEEALRFSSNNFFVWGAKLRSATMGEGIGRPSQQALQKLPKIMRAALWSDPDRLKDSPIAAPLAGHIIEAESIAGFQRATELTSKPVIIRNSQRAFVRWLETRKNLNPVSQDLADAAESLSVDDDVQSQVLYAYTLKEQGRFDEATRVLQQVVPLIENEKDIPLSSWPWTLAGDLHAQRSEWDQAFVFYESAIKRNPNDVAALWGLSIYYRENGKFIEAIQKKQEALSLDPSFVPARLRIPRFEWHRRVGR
jgi:tetratricopeptide (TPR) repeat protein